MTNKRVWIDNIFSEPWAINDHRQHISINYYNVVRLTIINIRISYTIIIEQTSIKKELYWYLIERKSSAKLISCSSV